MADEQSVQFGTYRLDPANARLWQGTQPLRLTPKAFQVLCFLAARPGQLVSKDELFAAVWADTVVSEAIAPLKQYLSRFPHILGAHLALASAYSQLGQIAEARAAAEVLRINLKFSLEVHKQRVPIKDPATLEKRIAALRKAGLK